MRGASRRRIPAVMGALVGLLLASACTTLDEDSWSFPLTRSVYGDLEEGPEHRVPNRDVMGPSGTADEAWILPALLLLPIAIDLVLLPVTLPHDVFFP